MKQQACLECNNILPKSKKWNKFCCQSHAASFNNKLRGERSDETKKKISNSLIGNTNKKKKNKLCVCGTVLENKKRTYCDSCKINKILSSKNISKYRTRCKFNFDLKEFPDEFNFSLIKEYGWYSPTNKKNNLTGVSRDHMVSVKYGFDNGIDPKIISHPANCQLLRHTENHKKDKNCSITFEQLLKRILLWEEKYGKK